MPRPEVVLSDQECSVVQTLRQLRLHETSLTVNFELYSSKLARQLSRCLKNIFHSTWLPTPLGYFAATSATSKTVQGARDSAPARL